MLLTELLDRWSQLETNPNISCRKENEGNYRIEYANDYSGVFYYYSKNTELNFSLIERAIKFAIREHGFVAEIEYSPSTKKWSVSIDMWNIPTACLSENEELAIALLDAYVQMLKSIAGNTTKHEEKQKYLFLECIIADGNEHRDCMIASYPEKVDKRSYAEALVSQLMLAGCGPTDLPSDEQGRWEWSHDDRVVALENVREISHKEFQTLVKFLVTVWVEYPYKISVEDDVIFHLVKQGEDEDKFLYQNLETNQVYDPFEVYCHMTGIHIREGFPEFEVESWIDADFSE